MKRRYLFVALVLTTGCSAILGFNDGKLSPGLQGDPCDLYNSPSTPCSAGLGCFASTCFGLCPADGPCPSGSRCLVSDQPSNGGGGIESNPRVCVPFDKARCSGQSGGNSSAPVCTNGGVEQCWNGDCRATCQLQQSGQTGPTTGVAQNCHAGETCIAQNQNANQGLCYAPSEASDSGASSGNTGTDLFVFGGNIDGPIAVGNANVYFGRDGGLWSCPRTGCNGGGSTGAQNVTTMNGGTPRFITTYGSGRIAWAYPPMSGTSGIQRCTENGPMCTVQNSPPFPYSGTQVWALQGLDQWLFWVTANGSTIGVNAYEEGLPTDGGSPSIGSFNAQGDLTKIGFHTITPEQHLVQVGGQMYNVAASQPVSQLFDPALVNVQGAPLITHANDRAIWVVESTDRSQLAQCHLDTSPAIPRTQVCMNETGVFYDYKAQGTKVTVTALGANGANSTMIYWAEWANDTTTIRACSPSGPFTAPACDGRLLTAEGNLPGKVVSLVADADGYVYYMLAYNSANQRNGVNFALRRVKGP